MKNLLIILSFNLYLNSATSNFFYVKNNSKYDLGLYIDCSSIIQNDAEDQNGDLLYCILKPGKQELVKLEKTIKDISNEKILYEAKDKKIVCDYTQGQNFKLEFTVIDSYDEFETEIKIPICNDKNQIIRYKLEKTKCKKPIFKNISKIKQIENNAIYKINYDEKTKELDVIQEN